MENASKALIIAGAILISIVLITFGVIILGQGSEVINSADMSEVEITTFNTKFTQFEGTNVRGSKVNALLNTVLQNNLSQDDEGKKVQVTGSVTLEKNAKTLSTKAFTGKTYSVTCSYSESGTGLVETITVTEK